MNRKNIWIAGVHEAKLNENCPSDAGRIAPKVTIGDYHPCYTIQRYLSLELVPYGMYGVILIRIGILMPKCVVAFHLR